MTGNYTGRRLGGPESMMSWQIGWGQGERACCKRFQRKGGKNANIQ